MIDDENAKLRKKATEVWWELERVETYVPLDEDRLFEVLHGVLALLDENEALRDDLRCSLQRNSQLDEECERLAERLNVGEVLRAKETARYLDLQKRLAKAYIDRLPEDYDAED